MMNSDSVGGSEQEVDDPNNGSESDLQIWVNELINDDYRFLFVNPGEAAMTINPNFPTQPNTIAINGGTVKREGSSANMLEAKSQPLQNQVANSSLPRSGQILSAAPNFVANPVAQSSRSSRTTDLSQYQPVQPSQPLQNQPLRQQVLMQKAIQQQPQIYSSMEQSNIIFGHQNNQNRLPSNQLQPYPRPMVNGQRSHLQNQPALWQQSSTSQLQQPQQQMVQSIQNFQPNLNKMQLQFQQPSGSSNNLIPENGQHRFQGFAVGDGQQKPQEQQQLQTAKVVRVTKVFRAPSEFPNTAAWCEYAVRQLAQMKERYFTDLLIMHRNAKQMSIQGKNTPEAPEYEKTKKFLEKIITFLSIPTADLIPKDYERVYGYMNFIVTYVQSYRIKNGVGSSQHSQLLVHQNLSQGVTNLETNMMNFNQNFPSRRPQVQPRIMATSSSSVSNVPFQTGMDQRPANSIQIGSFSGAQLNVLSTTQKSNGFLTTTTVNNFQSRQLINNQPTAVTAQLSSEKLKQPMQNMSPLGTSRMMNQFVHPAPFSLTSAVQPINQPINQHAAPGRSSWNAVSSSRVDANNVLSPQSIARSPFLLAGSSSTPTHADQKQLSSGISSLSTEESKKPETPTMSVQSAGDLGTIIIKDKVADLGVAPRTPTISSMDAPSTEKSQDSSQDLNDPHLRLIQAVKSLSSKALSSSLSDICSAKKAMNSIPYGEPTNIIAPYKKMEPNFLLGYDNEPINLISPKTEDESGFPLGCENEPERKIRRTLSITSVDRSSSPNFCDVESFDGFVFEEWDMDSTGTSMNKRSKIECKNWAILEEMKQLNGKLLETSLEVSEDNVSLHEDYEGTIVRCLYKNVSFPELPTLIMGGASSEKRPEFVIELFVPVDYPASSPIVSNSRCNVEGELGGMLFKEMVSRFERTVRELGEKMSIGDMARHWDACGRTVIMELAQQRGARNLVSSYGKWESCSY